MMIAAVFATPASPLLVGMMSIVVLLACVTTYTAIGVSGRGPMGWRIYSAAGWTLLVLRLGSVLFGGAYPTLPPLALISVVFIGAGAILLNVKDSSCQGRLTRTLRKESGR